MIYSVTLSTYFVLGIAVGTETLGRDDLMKVTKKTQFNSKVSTKHLLSRDKELALRWEENGKMHNLVTSLKEGGGIGGGLLGGSHGDPSTQKAEQATAY